MKVMAAFTSPLRGHLPSHSSAVKGNVSYRLIGLVGMNELTDATVRSAACHPGAGAAARGAMSTNRFQHPGRMPDRVQVSYQTAINSSEAVRQSDE
jgi:hypothetical protein